MVCLKAQTTNYFFRLNSNCHSADKAVVCYPLQPTNRTTIAYQNERKVFNFWSTDKIERLIALHRCYCSVVFEQENFCYYLIIQQKILLSQYWYTGSTPNGGIKNCSNNIDLIVFFISSGSPRFSTHQRNHQRSYHHFCRKLPVDSTIQNLH